MLYLLLYSWHVHFSPFNVFRYITFRTALATLSAMILSFWMGPWIVRRLKSLKIGESIRADGPQSHHSKAGTPTMGGVLIIAAILFPTLLWIDLRNKYSWIVLGSLMLFGLLGFIDDYIKLAKKRAKGLSIKLKLLLQTGIASGIGVVLYLLAKRGIFSTAISFPFVKQLNPDLGLFYIPFVVVVIVGCCNAVNLTDGLDGLAVGSILIGAATYAILAYIAGHSIASNYLLVPYIPNVGEISIFCGAIVGASLGFLWFNCYPAQMFMGDVGSLSLGGVIGTIAVLIKQEILLLIVGGLFVVEALSVIIQVISFRCYGKRVFRMAPLHHHFELSGWQEPKVIVRFWILAIIFALLALSSLKLR
jgi:phospho-N-acetylmuramoyl-pentapeptide-transferase